MFNKDSPLKIDKSFHSPHQIIPQLIHRKNSLVLDVGCNNGLVGKKIIELTEAIVDGIDINDAGLEEARKTYRKVFKRDLYKPVLEIDVESYDYIIFSDILRHLP